MFEELNSQITHGTRGRNGSSDDSLTFDEIFSEYFEEQPTAGAREGVFPAAAQHGQLAELRGDQEVELATGCRETVPAASRNHGAALTPLHPGYKWVYVDLSQHIIARALGELWCQLCQSPIPSPETHRCHGKTQLRPCEACGCYYEPRGSHGKRHKPNCTRTEPPLIWAKKEDFLSRAQFPGYANDKAAAGFKSKLVNLFCKSTQVEFAEWSKPETPVPTSTPGSDSSASARGTATGDGLEGFSPVSTAFSPVLVSNAVVAQQDMTMEDLVSPFAELSLPSVAEAKVAMAKEEVAMAREEVRVAKEEVKVAKEEVRVAGAKVDLAKEEVREAEDKVKMAEAKVEAASEGTVAAQIALCSWETARQDLQTAQQGLTTAYEGLKTAQKLHDGAVDNLRAIQNAAHSAATPATAAEILSGKRQRTETEGDRRDRISTQLQAQIQDLHTFLRQPSEFHISPQKLQQLLDIHDDALSFALRNGACARKDAEAFSKRLQEIKNGCTLGIHTLDSLSVVVMFDNFMNNRQTTIGSWILPSSAGGLVVWDRDCKGWFSVRLLEPDGSCHPLGHGASVAMLAMHLVDPCNAVDADAFLRLLPPHHALAPLARALLPRLTAASMRRRDAAIAAKAAVSGAMEAFLSKTARDASAPFTGPPSIATQPHPDPSASHHESTLSVDPIVPDKDNEAVLTVANDCDVVLSWGSDELTDDEEITATQAVEVAAEMLDVNPLLSPLGAQDRTEQGKAEDRASVAFSPDSKLCASASKDNTVKLRSIETRTEVSTLGGHRRRVTSPDNNPSRHSSAETIVSNRDCHGCRKLFFSVSGKSLFCTRCREFVWITVVRDQIDDQLETKIPRAEVRDIDDLKKATRTLLAPLFDDIAHPELIVSLSPEGDVLGRGALIPGPQCQRLYIYAPSLASQSAAQGARVAGQ